jgi:hypothetical protein
MEAAVAKRSRAPSPREPDADAAPGSEARLDLGKRAGSPLLAAAPVQHACARCGTGAPRLQRKEAAGAGRGAPRIAQGVRAEARAGVASAAEPLPHRERIQAAFGDHDVGAVRVQVGGPAAAANDAMGSLAYATGDRIGFRGPPDLRLAAHEAAHVVQQRAGVRIAGGVGQPGDAHERQADEVADAVVAGRSAAPILDRTTGGAPGAAVQKACACGTCERCQGGAAPVQHHLQVNARRHYEAGLPDGGVPDGAPAEGEAPARPAEDGGEAEPTATPEPDAAAGPDGGGPPASAAPATPAAPVPPGTASVPTQTATAGGTARADAAGATPGPVNAHCFNVAPQPPPEPVDERPKNPPPGESREQITSESTEAPDTDECPAEAAIDQRVSAEAPAQTAVAQATAAVAGPAPAAAAAAPAAAGGGATPAAEGGGAAGAEAEPAASPIEDAIAGAEAARDGSVEKYVTATAALEGAGRRARALPGAVPLRGPAAASVTAVLRQAAGTLERSVDEARDAIPLRLGRLAERLKRAVAVGLDKQKDAISATVERARRQARAQAGIALGAIHGEHATTVAAIRTETGTAIEAIRAQRETSQGDVTTKETTQLGAINDLYTDAKQAHRELGPVYARKVDERRNLYVGEYRRCINPDDDTFWSGNLSERRANAQISAANQTADGYHKSMIDVAEQQAGQIWKGRQKDRCAVIASARAARHSLDDRCAELVDSLESSRDRAIRSADASRRQMAAGVRASLRATMTRLADQERAQRQQADDTAYLQQVVIEQVTHDAVAGLQGTVTSAVEGMEGVLGRVQGQLAGAGATEPAALERILAQVTAAVDGGVTRLDGHVMGGEKRAQASIARTGASATAALDAVGDGNQQLADGLIESFTASMQSSAASAQQAFAGQRAGYVTQTTTARTSGVAALQGIVTALETSFATIASGVAARLEESRAKLEDSLKSSLAGLDSEATGIPKHAYEAASKEQPAWKAVVKWVLIIAIVIVVALVVGPAVIGAVGALAGTLGASAGLATVIGTVVGGAIVGAATSAVMQVINNFAEGATSWDALTAGVGKAALIGALTGALGAGLGAGVGAGVRLISNTVGRAVVQFVASTVLDVAMDLGVALATDQLSWDDLVSGRLPWTDLARTLAMSVATGSLGNVRRVQSIQSRAMQRGASVVPGRRAAAFQRHLRIQESRAQREHEAAQAARRAPPAPDAPAPDAPAARAPEAEAPAAHPAPDAQPARPAADGSPAPRPDADAAPAAPRAAESPEPAHPMRDLDSQGPPQRANAPDVDLETPVRQLSNEQLQQAATRRDVGDIAHDIAPQSRDGRIELHMCSDLCASIRLKIEQALATVHGNSKVAKALKQLRADVEAAETRLQSGDLPARDLVHEVNQVADQMAALGRQHPDIGRLLDDPTAIPTTSRTRPRGRTPDERGHAGREPLTEDRWNTSRWSADDEARWLGYPEAPDGHHWTPDTTTGRPRLQRNRYAAESTPRLEYDADALGGRGAFRLEGARRPGSLAGTATESLYPPNWQKKRGDAAGLQRHASDIDAQEAKYQERLQRARETGDVNDAAHSQRKLTEVEGERAATKAMLETHPDFELARGFASGTGYDQVWVRRVNGKVVEIIIVEAKGPGATLSAGAVKGDQMSTEWVRTTAEQMATSDTLPPAQRELADKILEGLDSGHPPVRGRAVEADPHSPTGWRDVPIPGYRGQY